MPRGQTDFGEYAPTRTIAGMSDMGELAARLGSINTYDRKGQTIWQEDFEDGIVKWWTNVTGAGGSVASSVETARNGGKSAKLVSGTTAGNLAQMSRFVSRAVSSRIGVEISYTTSNDVGTHDLTIYTNEGDIDFVPAIRYDPVLKILYYYNDLGVFVAFAADVMTYKAINYFAQMKLVFDLDTGYYVKCLFGADEYDLSEYKFPQGGGLNLNWLGVNYKVTSRATPTTSTTYLDDVILTQNEP